MADPISAIGLVATIAQIIPSICDYGRNVKNAQSDIQSLSGELFALKGILEHIGAQQISGIASSDHHPLVRYDPEEFSHMLQTTGTFLNLLLGSLEEPKDRSKKAMQSLKWPFKKSDMNLHLSRLGQVKTWFLLAMMTDDLAATQTTYSKVLELEQILNADREAREREKADSVTRELLMWLAPVGPGEAHTHAMQLRQPGTGYWFIDGLFREWLNAKPGDSSVLWLTGSSGSGKTILLSHAIEMAKGTLPEGSGTGVGYYYCRFDDSRSLLPVNVLGSLAAQLSTTSPTMLDDLQPIFEEKRSLGQQGTLGLKELEDLIIKYCANLPVVLFFIDALNESNHYSLIAASLLRLARRSESLRILVTSTSVPPGTGSPLYRVAQMPPRRIAEDIRTCVESRLKQHPNLQSLSENLKEDIRKALIAESGGMFRWAQLSLLHISAQRTGRDVRNALRLMPQDLDKTYASILCRIPQTDQNLAREALTWLSFTRRPLRISELCEAIVLRESDTTLDSDSRLHTTHTVVEICQGLVRCSGFRVTLAHSSIKEFLVSEWIKSSPAKFFSIDTAAAKRALTRKCLTYLCFQDFNDGYKKSYSEYAVRCRLFPFLEYAAENWPIYANSCELDAEDYRHMARFLATKKLSRGGNFSSWIQCLAPKMAFSRIESTEPLYYAASFGLLPLVRHILTTQPDTDIDARGGRNNSTALFVALWRENFQVAELLLKHGADPALKDLSTGLTPLGFANKMGFSEIAKVLKRYLSRNGP